jgi:mannose-6-phosphate isomerase-like protein (cupin superfamily)
MRWWLILFPAILAAQDEGKEVWKAAEIERLLAETRQDRMLLARPAYEIRLRVIEGRFSGKAAADHILQVRKGRGMVSVGGKRHEVGAGDFLHVVRNTPHEIVPGGGRLELVVLRIVATGENLPERRGLLAPRRMPEVLRKAEIDATIATHQSNQPLHASKAYTMNYVIYPGKPGPWEAHRGCVDIYIVQHGTAKALLGGRITNVREQSPGEIRGDGVEGAREYEIGPGDLVHIPRNGAHHMVPAGDKLAYLLLKIWAD